MAEDWNDPEVAWWRSVTPPGWQMLGINTFGSVIWEQPDGTVVVVDKATVLALKANI